MASYNIMASWRDPHGQLPSTGEQRKLTKKLCLCTPYRYLLPSCHPCVIFCLTLLVCLLVLKA